MVNRLSYKGGSAASQWWEITEPSDGLCRIFSTVLASLIMLCLSSCSFPVILTIANETPEPFEVRFFLGSVSKEGFVNGLTDQGEFGLFRIVKIPEGKQVDYDLKWDAVPIERMVWNSDSTAFSVRLGGGEAIAFDEVINSVSDYAPKRYARIEIESWKGSQLMILSSTMIKNALEFVNQKTYAIHLKYL